MNTYRQTPEQDEMKAKKSKAEIDAHFEGGLAYNDGKQASANPHSESDVLAKCWLEGWEEACEYDNQIPSE